MSRLEFQLAHPGRPPVAPLPEPLRRRLLAAVAAPGTPAPVHPSSPRSVASGSPPLWLRWALPVALTAACVVLALQLTRPGPKPAPAAGTLTLTLGGGIASLPKPSALPELAEAAQEPLTRELAVSLADSRNFLVSMVRGTLPDTAADALMRETGLIPRRPRDHEATP